MQLYNESRAFSRNVASSISAKSIVIEAAELLDKLGLDADEIVNMKMEQNEKKYPVEKAKGSAAKYDEL